MNLAGLIEKIDKLTFSELLFQDTNGHRYIRIRCPKQSKINLSAKDIDYLCEYITNKIKEPEYSVTWCEVINNVIFLDFTEIEGENEIASEVNVKNKIEFTDLHLNHCNDDSDKIGVFKGDIYIDAFIEISISIDKTSREKIMSDFLGITVTEVYYSRYDDDDEYDCFLYRFVLHKAPSFYIILALIITYYNMFKGFTLSVSPGDLTPEKIQSILDRVIYGRKITYEDGKFIVK